MKVALVQESPVVGDLQGNVDALLAVIAQAKQRGAVLAVCTELAICAYPPRDLLNESHFVRAQREALDRLAQSALLPTLVGFVDCQEIRGVSCLFNAVALIENGQVSNVVHKTLLPSYDVFDERRYFTPATERRLLSIGEFRVGVSICEDIWNNSEARDDSSKAVESLSEQHRPRHWLDPIEELVALGATLLINISASPFWADKRATRRHKLQAQARRHKLPLLVVNQVGAYDDLIFDGGSLAIDATGEVRGVCREFESDLLVVEVSRTTITNIETPRHVHSFDETGETEACLDALVLGVRDYARNCGFRSAVLGLSGGIDSALTAAIAASALGADHVHGIALPSRYSSEHSLTDAKALAMAMNIHYQVLPIDPSVRALEASLAETFAGTSEGITEENIQARVRGVLLMALSNKFGHLLLNTGNKSEVAVGYCTLYGDMCGGLSVLSDVFKTDVYKLSLAVNRRAGRAVIPLSTIDKPPSAELRPGQLDQDSLPPYPVLDEMLRRYVENCESLDSLAKDFGAERAQRVVALIRRAEYKRTQLAPGLKVRSKSFGPGRRMPLSCRITENNS